MKKNNRKSQNISEKKSEKEIKKSVSDLLYPLILINTIFVMYSYRTGLKLPVIVYSAIIISISIFLAIRNRLSMNLKRSALYQSVILGFIASTFAGYALVMNSEYLSRGSLDVLLLIVIGNIVVTYSSISKFRKEMKEVQQQTNQRNGLILSVVLAVILVARLTIDVFSQDTYKLVLLLLSISLSFLLAHISIKAYKRYLNY